MLTQRVEIDRTFAEAAGSGETLSVDQLVTFLQHQQREEAAGPALALSLIERYEPSETGESLTRACHLQLQCRTGPGDPWGDCSQKDGSQREGAASASPAPLLSTFQSHESRQMRDRAPASLPFPGPVSLLALPSGGFENLFFKKPERWLKSRCYSCFLFCAHSGPALRCDRAEKLWPCSGGGSSLGVQRTGR